MSSLKRFLAPAVLISSALACAPSRAATIDAFSFTQSYNSGGHTATLIGQFTGVENSAGYITKDSLTAFEVHFDYDGRTIIASYVFTVLGLFSFNATQPIDNGSLGITSLSAATQGILCVGAPAAFGCLEHHGRGAVFMNGFGSIFTDSAPVVFLESQVVTGVPEPSTWAMMLIGFTGLGAWAQALRKRRSGRPDKTVTAQFDASAVLATSAIHPEATGRIASLKS